MKEFRKVLNPFNKLEGYHCFGCHDEHPFGLKLKFVTTEDIIISEWQPDSMLDGYFDILHGGIQSTLLDEIGIWWIYTHGGTAGVTSKMEVKFKNAANTNNGPLYLVAKKIDQKRNIFLMNAKIFNKDKKLLAEADLQYFTVSQKAAQRDLHYPEQADFKGELMKEEEIPEIFYDLSALA